MNLSPGIVGMYWLLASVAAAALWSLTATIVRRASHNARARCCGMCER